MLSSITVSSLVGPWSGDTSTGLTARCKNAWDIPLQELSDLMVATFLNQGIAASQMTIEAQRRLQSQERDGTEYFDGQLLEALTNAAA